MGKGYHALQMVPEMRELLEKLCFYAHCRLEETSFVMDIHCKTWIEMVLSHLRRYSSAFLTSFCRHSSISRAKGRRKWGNI